MSGATVEAFRGYLDRDALESADRVAFAVQALVAYARQLAPQEPK
jgi:hypothetical protein